MSKELNIFLLGGSNLQNFSSALKKEFREANISSVEYGQMLPYLVQLEPAEQKLDLCICWLAVSDILQAEATKVNLSELVLKLERSFQYLIIILPGIDTEAFNTFQGNGLRKTLYRLNLDLVEQTSAHTTCVLDPTPWMISQGKSYLSSSLWYLSKTPYHINVYKAAASMCKSAWNAWMGLSKKLLMVDLDDTLWGGIVGDDGWQNLKIGGHDALGEAFAHFQQWIKELKEGGLMLAICSKNNEANAMEVFEKHDGMVLKKEDFVGWRINWEDKAANIVDLVKGLNIGMDSVVFFDDNPVERNRIKTALPEIFVPELPEDKLEYPAFIRSLTCFNRLGLTEEDKKRTLLYQQETERKEKQNEFANVNDWIASLQIEVKFEQLNEGNINRAEQLLNKTNQMNLRTRRLNKEELEKWSNENNHWFYVVYVKDIFGDNGITGLLGFHLTDNDKLFIDDFVMSCRVMGRKIEHQMLEFLQERASENKATLRLEYLPTEKNSPIKQFLDSVVKDYPGLEIIK